MVKSPASARLSPRALRRYSRHLLIPEIALAGQEKLARARVLVVGAGGLGSPALEYLAAAGVGRIGIADDDLIDETNLQRQPLYATSDVQKKKVEVAQERLMGLNPHIAVDAIPFRIDASNARDLIKLYDIVLDCTDRFESRYLINDACFLENKPDVYASIFRFDAQVAVFGGKGCYRCVFPEWPSADTVPTCAEGGVLGVLAGIAGTWQANEAIKLLVGIGEPLVGRMMLVDALHARVREVRLVRDPQCELCGERPVITMIDAMNYQTSNGAILQRDETAAAHENIENAPVQEIDPADLDSVLRDSIVLDVREPHEAVLGIIEGAVHIPASQLEANLHRLDSAESYVVACRSGVKSRWAANRLYEAGFRRIRHLRGGLIGYACRNEGFAIF